MTACPSTVMSSDAAAARVGRIARQMTLRAWRSMWVLPFDSDLGFRHRKGRESLEPGLLWRLPVKGIGGDDDLPSGGRRSLLRHSDGCLQRVNARLKSPTCERAAERVGPGWLRLFGNEPLAGQKGDLDLAAGRGAADASTGWSRRRSIRPAASRSPAAAPRSLPAKRRRCRRSTSWPARPPGW